MFSGCSSLSDLTPLTKWDVSKCTNLDSMFKGCSSLTKRTQLTEWNVSKCTKFKSMFQGCSSLSDIRGLEKWKSKKPDIDFNEMFYDCFCLFNLNLIEKK